MTGERDAGFVRVGADAPPDTDVVVDLVDEVAALDRLREHLADGHLLAGKRLENGDRLEFDLPRPGPHPDPMHVDRERVIVETGDDVIEPGAVLAIDEHGLLVGRPDPDTVADALIDVAHDADVLEQLTDAITPSYVYVASSWRNRQQPEIVERIRAAGVDCYDFRNPAPGEHGFAWSDIDPEWLGWSADQYVAALEHPIAEHGFGRDFAAMERADTFVLVLPCGRSAHLELGWAVGAGKRTAILTSDGEEPELMAKMVDHIATSPDDLLRWLVGGASW